MSTFSPPDEDPIAAPRAEFRPRIGEIESGKVALLSHDETVSQARAMLTAAEVTFVPDDYPEARAEYLDAVAYYDEKRAGLADELSYPSAKRD